VRVSEGLEPQGATWSEHRNTLYLPNDITVGQSSYLEISQVRVQSVSKTSSVGGRNVRAHRRED
jgi:hypothetical protein